MRETALWSLARVHPAALHPCAEPLTRDANPAIAQLSRQLLNEKIPDALTIERVIILKSVSILSDISERGLVEAASVLEEIRVEPEQMIFEKGDTGNSLYVIVEGGVRVHNGEKTIAVLGPGEVFGELAALDPEPRMASVPATEPTLLLRMGHAELDELMSEHPEIATGIVHVLCRRLRKQT